MGEVNSNDVQGLKSTGESEVSFFTKSIRIIGTYQSELFMKGLAFPKAFDGLEITQ